MSFWAEKIFSRHDFSRFIKEFCEDRVNLIFKKDNHLWLNSPFSVILIYRSTLLKQNIQYSAHSRKFELPMLFLPWPVLEVIRDSKLLCASVLWVNRPWKCVFRPTYGLINALSYVTSWQLLPILSTAIGKLTRSFKCCLVSCLSITVNYRGPQFWWSYQTAPKMRQFVSEILNCQRKRPKVRNICELRKYSIGHQVMFSILQEFKMT